MFSLAFRNLCGVILLTLLSIMMVASASAEVLVGTVESSDSVAPPPVPESFQDLEKLLEGIGDRDDHAFLGGMALMIPILAVLLIFGGPLLLVILLAVMHFRSRNRQAELQHASIARVVESGQPVPEDILRQSLQTSVHQGVRGLRNIGLGLGLLAFLWVVFGPRAGAIGFLFIGIGLSQVAVWKFVDSRPSGANSFTSRDQ